MLLLLACAAPLGSSPPLTVLSLSPSHGQVGVSTSASLTAVFSEPLEPDSAEAWLLDDQDAAVPVALSLQGAVLSLSPLEPLAPERDWTLVLDGDLQGLSGARLGAEVSATFSTGPSEPEDDTEPEPIEVQPPHFTIGGAAVVDQGLWPWWVEGQGTDPWLRLSFYDEGAEAGDPAVCSWWAWLEDRGTTSLPAGAGAWGAWTVRMERMDDECEGFEADVWGEDSPDGVLDGAELAIGLGPLGAEDRAELQARAEARGEDWSEWADRLFTVWVGLDDGAGGWEVFPAAYGAGWAVDDEHALVLVDGAEVPLDATAVSQAPAMVAVTEWRMLDTRLLLR